MAVSQKGSHKNLQQKCILLENHSSFQDPNSCDIHHFNPLAQSVESWPRDVMMMIVMVVMPAGFKQKIGSTHLCWEPKKNNSEMEIIELYIYKYV